MKYHQHQLGLLCCQLKTIFYDQLITDWATRMQQGGTRATRSQENVHVRPSGKLSQHYSHLSAIVRAGGGFISDLHILEVINTSFALSGSRGNRQSPLFSTITESKGQTLHSAYHF